MHDFGIENGLANNGTIDIEVPSEPYKAGKTTKVTKIISVPSVSILDPAAGTGTFHAEVIRYIYETYFSGGKEAFFSNYILDSTGLLSRLIGFEIVMTSYVVAHLKVKRTIKEFLPNVTENSIIPSSRVYLTNTLAPAQTTVEPSDQISWFHVLDFSGAVSEESRKADIWKTLRPVRVILGNPPYNANVVVDYDIDSYKKKGDNAKKLNDIYVKFFRFAEQMVDKSGSGILAFVSNHGYLENPTFRGMRTSLLETFDKIYILDLHGNAHKQAIAPDGSKDENVFDIMQGVAIIIAVKKTHSKAWAKVYHSELWGSRTSKFTAMLEGIITFSEHEPDTRMAYFTPQNVKGKAAYENGISIKELFHIVNTGFVTANDKLNISLSRSEAQSKICDLEKMDENAWRDKYNRPKDAVNWQYLRAKKDAEQRNGQYVQFCYRPFDRRWTYYTGTSNGLYVTPGSTLAPHFLSSGCPLPDGKNIGITFSQTSYSDVPPFIADGLIEGAYFSKSTNSITSLAPLYLKVNELVDSWEPNFNEKAYRALTAGIQSAVEPIDILDYVYGVLYDPKYRELYGDLLKKDYPRVPVINHISQEKSDTFFVDEQRFWDYVSIGRLLRETHLLKTSSRKISLGISSDKDLLITKIKYSDNILIINNSTQIYGIPENVYNYILGGYPIIKKWLSNHLGEALSIDSFLHLEKMVNVINDTINIVISKYNALHEHMSE